jgi:hypothetical protein
VGAADGGGRGGRIVGGEARGERAVDRRAGDEVSVGELEAEGAELGADVHGAAAYRAPEISASASLVARREHRIVGLAKDRPMDYELTKRVLAALQQHGVAYKVFGAVALNLHGLARATEALDIFIAPDADNIARLRSALRSVFEDSSIDEITAEDLLGEYPAVQYVPPSGTFYIDILTRLGELFDYAGLESETVDFDGIPVTVVTARTLYEMKKSTVRAKDRGDAEALARRFKLGGK